MTQQILTDWFGLREICDEAEKWLIFWRRNLSRYYPRYKLLLDTELKCVPAFLTYQRATFRQYDSSGENSTTHTSAGGSTLTTDTTNTTNTTAYGDSTTDTSSSTSTSADTNTTTNTTTSTVTTTSDTSQATQTTPDTHANLSRVLPQSTVYNSGTTAEGYPLPQIGFPESLEWTYATTQTEDRTTAGAKTTTTTGTNDTDTTTGTTGEDHSTGSTTGSGTNTTEYRDKTENSSNGNSKTTTETTGNDTTTGTTGNKTTERTSESGSDRPEAEIREIVRSYIVSSDSLRYLLDNLEICFMGVYE